MIWLLFACVRSISPALEVDPPIAAAADAEPGDPAGRLAWMIGSDPLVRRPRMPAGPVPSGLDAFVTATRREAPTAQDWWNAELTGRGTVSVAFARGARLAELEASLGAPLEALAWVVPLAAPGPAVFDPIRPTLAWLGDVAPEALLVVQERRVLLGWLDGPAIDVRPAALALGAPTYDRVATTPAGLLLLARAAGASDAAAGAEGARWLEEATWLAAMGAAANRDAEQATLRELRREASARWSLTGDPLAGLLDGAEARLRADARSDASSGGALLAQAARRWAGACPDAPCGGMDRVEAMRVSAGWGTSALAAAWQAIAMKAAIDRLDAAWDSSSFPVALDDVVEALIGTGGGTIDRSILRRARPDPAVNLQLVRSAGGGDLTGRDELFHALNARVAALATAAAAAVPARIAEPLTRIAKRAGK